MDLFKYNDNSKNKFSDNYYRAALVEAIVETLTPVVSAVSRTGINQVSSESLSSETKLILDEITRYLNMEKLLPCYHFTVTVSCLKAFRHLQKMGHLPNNPKFFQHYTQYGLFRTVRVTAVEALVDIIKVEQQKDYLMFLLNLVEYDPVPSFRYDVLRLLTENPPISNNDSRSPLNTEEILEKIWTLMNTTLAFDTRLRAACVDMYYAFYGKQRPSCLPKSDFSFTVKNFKNGQKTIVNSNLQEDNGHLFVSKETETYQPNLDFDQAFKRKLPLEDSEIDDFDEKFNREKRFKNFDFDNQYSEEKSDLPTGLAKDTANEDYESNVNDQEEEGEIGKLDRSQFSTADTSNLPQTQQDSQSRHSDYYYQDPESNDNYTATQYKSTFSAHHENSNTARSGFNSPLQSNSNLNEDAQDYPPSNLDQLHDQQQSSDQIAEQQQMPLTFSLSKFGLHQSTSTSTGEVVREKVKEKKNKSKDRDKDEHGSKEHKKKKKKKHKKHKHKSKDKSKDQPDTSYSASNTTTTATINTPSLQLASALLKTDSQLVMSASDSSNQSAPNTP